MIHWPAQWLRRAIALLYSLHGDLTMPEQKGDEGTLDVSIITAAVGFGARFIPGKGGEQHLKNALWELAKFLDARYEAIDQMLDIDG